MTGSRTHIPKTLKADQPLAFHFDGTLYQGYAGDSLASALIANGVTLIGRSFKYHRACRRKARTAGPRLISI